MAEEEQENTEKLEGAEPSQEEQPAEGAEQGAQAEEAQPEDKEQAGTETPEQTGFQKRINKVTADKYRYKGQAEALQAELDEINSRQAATSEKEPNQDDFDYDEDYIKAKVNFEVARKTKSLKAEQSQAGQRQARERLGSEYAARVQKANIDGFDESLQNLQSVSFSADVVDAIQEDAKGPEIVHYLGQHIDLADRIASSSPAVAGMEIGRLSAQLSNQKLKPSSKAPKPPQTLGGGAQSSKKLEDMSMEEVYERSHK